MFKTDLSSVRAAQQIARETALLYSQGPDCTFCDSADRARPSDASYGALANTSRSWRVSGSGCVEFGLQSYKGEVIGTPAYAAPEGGGLCDEKADIYSGALILLELLCPRFTTVMERVKTLEDFKLNYLVRASHACVWKSAVACSPPVPPVGRCWISIERRRCVADGTSSLRKRASTTGGGARSRCGGVPA